MTDQISDRKKKLSKLLEIKQNPYLVDKVDCNSSVVELLKYSRTESFQIPKDEFSAIGRIVSIRQPFATLRDAWNDLQLYCDAKESAYSYLDSYVDIGDFVFVKGQLFKTKIGKLALRTVEMQIISKCLNPFPSQYYGIKDDDLKARDRIARAFADKDFWDTMVLRSQIVSEIRKYLNDNGYFEIETPILNTTYGGANALPFVTYFEALKENFFLRIATEIPLKKAVIAGFSKVYELGKVFRNEGVDSSHNPEFTSLEVYSVNMDLQNTIDFTENLIRHISSTFAIRDVAVGESYVYIDKPFKRVSMYELVKERINVDFYNEQITLDKAMELAKFYDIELESYEKTVGHIFQKLFDELVSKSLVEPTFVYGFHKDVSPLAKLDPKNPDFTLRFELYIGGIEYANGFEELNDPDDQKSRFEKQQSEREEGNKEAFEIDEDYVYSLQYGLPPTGGVGMGIDRLVMLFTQNKSIRDVIFFPQVKR